MLIQENSDNSSPKETANLANEIADGFDRLGQRYRNDLKQAEELGQTAGKLGAKDESKQVLHLSFDYKIHVQGNIYHDVRKQTRGHQSLSLSYKTM